MQWYYSVEGKSVGPLSENDFQKLVFSGTISPQTLVWHEGLKEWVPYGTLNQAAAPAAKPASAAEGTGKCCECGKEFPADELIKYENSLVCAGCKPVFFQRLQEGAALPGKLEFAGIGARFGAKFLDSIILGIVNAVLSLVTVGKAVGSNPETIVGTQLVLFVVQTTIGLGYYVFFLGKFGATPGKMACKIKVVRANGSPITYGRACGRFFGDMLSGLIIGIGYLMAISDAEKRCLHDRICDTRVIKNQ